MSARSDPARSISRATASTGMSRCSASSRSRMCRMPALRAADRRRPRPPDRIRCPCPSIAARSSPIRSARTHRRRSSPSSGRTSARRARARRRIHEPQALVRVGGEQLPERRASRNAPIVVLLEPAVAVLRRDDDDLGAVGLARAARPARARQLVVREVLALDVDRPLRRGDRVEKQRFAFADRPAAFRSRASSARSRRRRR